MKIKIEEIEAEIVKKDVRRINMRIYPDGKVKISVPKHVPEKEIFLFLSERLDWIRRTREKLFQKEERSLLFNFQEDKTVFLFGKEFELLTDNSFRGIAKNGEEITVGSKGLSNEEREKLFESFLKSELEKKLSVLVPKWEVTTGLSSSSWKIKKVKSYWGKCKPKSRELFFNLNLVHFEEKCIEYVVLHELAHIKFPNHQNEFKAFLSEHMPDWKEKSSLLK